MLHRQIILHTAGRLNVFLSSWPSAPCEEVDEAHPLLAVLLLLAHAGEGNSLAVLGGLVERTDFQMSRYRRDVGHVPQIHCGEEVTELPHLERKKDQKHITARRGFIIVHCWMDWMVQCEHLTGLALHLAPPCE